MYRTFGRPRVAGVFLAAAVFLLAACTAPSPTPAKPTEASKPAAPPAAPAVPSPVTAAPSPSPSVNPITTTSDVVPPPASAAIKITVPAANASVPAGDLRVAYDLTNITTVPAAEAKKVDDLHLHVLLDVDPAAYLGTTTFIPLGNPSIIHTAAKEVTFKDVKAGSHKVTVILTGANHISTKPPISDTVTFNVQ
jgi:hypothetical protein